MGTSAELRVAAAVAMAVVAGSGPAAAVDPLPAASSDDHIWFVVKSNLPQPLIELRHHAREMEGPYYSRGVPLSQVPEAMAAWGNRLWLIFGDETSGRREVFTVEVARNPELGLYFHTPPDRLRAVAPLEGPGTLADFAATAEGPTALLLPSRQASGPGLDGPKLLQLRGRDWVEMELPAGFEPDGTCRLGLAGPRGRMLVLINVPAGARGTRAARANTWWREGQGRWTRSDIPAELSGLRGTARVGGNIVLILDADRPGALELRYLRRTQLLELAGLATPEDRWAIVGVRDGLRLIEVDALGDVAIRGIDPISGAVGRRRDMARHTLSAGRLLHRPLLLAVAVTALMAGLLLRPDPKTATVDLPRGAAICSAMTRLVAITIDLAAGATVTLLVLRCPPADLVRMPMWTTDLAESIPYLMMVGVTALHGTITELATGRSLGKAFVGARVVTTTGVRPSAATILFRNAFKILVLLIPVLAVFALLNPNVQGLGDSVARTVVVRDAKAAANDR